MAFKTVKMKSTNPLENMLSMDLSRMGIVEHNEVINNEKVYDVPKNRVRQLQNAGFVIVETPKRGRPKKIVESEDD